jgi:AcrR family transcriptional regulator
MSDSSQKWIGAGYEVFSIEGPEGVQVEKLARRLGMNKSGFYHHFGDRDVFLSMLMEHHYRVNGLFFNEAMQLKKFFPDYLDLLYKYKTPLLVQMQLRRHLEVPMFNKEFNRTAKRNEKALIPLWADYLKIPGNHNLARELWDVVRDIFFIRAKVETLTPEFLHSIIYEFSQMLDLLKKYAVKPDSAIWSEK